MVDNKNLDDKIISAFGYIPCLSPARYQSFFVLSQWLNNIIKKPADIIDFGCGGGWYARFLAEIGVRGRYVGIDKKFKEAPKRQSLHGLEIDFIEMDILNFRTSEKFTLALFLWTSEHIKDDKKALNSVARNIRSGGRLILGVPARTSWLFQFGRHGYHYYSFSHLKKMVGAAGFTVEDKQNLGGVMDIIFNLIYHWSQIIILLPLYPFLRLYGLINNGKSDIDRPLLTKKIIKKSIFLYQNYRLGCLIHFKLIKLLSKIDQLLSFLPTSYLIVCKKR